MAKVILSFLLSFSCGLAIAAPKEFMVDTAKSTVTRRGKKVTGEHHGLIKIKKGQLVFKENQFTGGNFIIDMTSITNLDLENPEYNTKLVNHLKSDDFFSADKFPETRLTIKKVEPIKAPDYKIFGDLTIKDKTLPVEFKSTVSQKDNKATLNTKLVIDRTNYGIQYKSGKFFKSLGDKLIYDDFEVDVKLVAQ